MDNIDLYIEGISDRRVTDAIRQRVRRVREVVPQRGEWRVTISPSETRGQWDLGVQVSSTRHFASFRIGVDHLPDVIESQMREFLGLLPSVPDVTPR